MQITANRIVDAKGLTCPMPIVKAKKAMMNLEPGQVMEVQAIDKGSIADLKAWAENTGHQYIGTVEGGDLLKHYLRKASDPELKEEIKHEYTIELNKLHSKLNEPPISILDVCEPVEFAFGHIPGAVNIPLEELDERLDEIDQNKELYIICRTGNRSDLAAQNLTEKGYKNVINVLPGMSTWDSPIEKN
ncbi:hypothetical protein F3157_16610 [Virgibacillus dakarensis]|uniref:sulfurtransferase TusA family protein n=1 Tax=Virgibacillus dakarensis TaxID=1917889 RepID=UPI000B42F6F8|nr:sulfurtransferase TusA family protein [Virgibacillus dakarensis]MBT2215422.1 sulfurtransferase TusA family protein [Virgibacillus dakarensis]MTW87261.1 hypothetical protein [Virgibacillus dakarensis]